MFPAHSVQNSTLQHIFGPDAVVVGVAVVAVVPVVAAVVVVVAVVVPVEQQAPVSRVKLLLQVSQFVLSVRHLEQPFILQIVVVVVVEPDVVPVA